MKSLRFSRSRAVSLWGCALAILLSASSASAESIDPGETYSQDFDSMGSSATESLPIGWMAAKATAIRSVTQELYQGAGSATTQTGTGSGNANGIYNWVDAGNPADHGVGFLASSTQTKTGNLYLWLEAGGVIPDFTISYDMKCYRNNSRQFQFQLYYSTDDGATWTSAGSSFCTTYNTGTAGEVDPAGVTSVASETLELSEPLSSGDSIIFCWSYSVPSGSTTSNSQGLGIDNVVIEAGSSNLTQLNPPDVTVWAEKNDLWLSWTANEHAYGYELQVLDPDGESVDSWSFNQEQSASQWSGVHVERLAEETEYTVRLRVIGDGVTYATSAWFEDTFSTTADPWRPEWTIGDPTPSPFVGTAFSFGVSALCYEEQWGEFGPEQVPVAQTVSFDGLTPVPTGTQPTFANGVFSWTPGMDDDGNYVAAFSVQNDGGTYSTNVAFSVRGLTEEIELFVETFAKCAGSDWGNANGGFSSGYADDNHEWVVAANTYRGVSGLKLGPTKSANSATTPTIHPNNDAAASVTISFLAAGIASGNTMSVTVKSAEDASVVYDTRTITLAAYASTSAAIPETAGYAFTNTVSVGGPFTITFAVASGDGRMGIDSVRVVQTVSTLQTDLAVPTGLALVDGTLSTNSFSVAWNPVANATGYDVQFRPSGETDWTAAPSVLTTNATLSGLADDVEYAVQVRATGDTSLYNYSDWTNVTIRTVRSALHPTLTVGASWANVLGDGKLYGVIPNTNSVSATLDDGVTPVAVALAAVDPAPSSAPVLDAGALSWTPAEADEKTTFTLTFEMTPAPGVVYATNITFKVNNLSALKAPTVTVDASSLTNADGFASGRAGLSWDSQFRATGYAVRAWTGCPNPAATATHVEEHFPNLYASGADVKPAGWFFKTQGAYSGDKVKFTDPNAWMATWNLGGTITNVSFVMSLSGTSSGTNSVLSLYGTTGTTNKTDWVLLKSWSEQDKAISGTANIDVDASLDISLLVWQLTKENGGGNVGVGSVAIDGTGFSTSKFLPGWGPAAKDVGLVHSCTVSPTRPGRKNWVEVTVTDGTKTFSRVKEIDVPGANPVTMLIFK